MGWFDDHHYAGEAFNFGMGYAAGNPYFGAEGLSDCGLSDDDFRGGLSDDDFSGDAWGTSYRSQSSYRDQPRIPGRNATTGKYFYGTRKCSVCEKLKLKEDFSAEEESESAAKRCCLACSHEIVHALRSLDQKKQMEAEELKKKAEAALSESAQPNPAPAAAPVVIGRTHRVYGPDKASFVTCSCGCKESAPASMWYQGLKTCKGMTDEILKSFVLVEIAPKKPTKSTPKAKPAKPDGEAKDTSPKPPPAPSAAEVKEVLSSRGLFAAAGLKASLLARLRSRHLDGGMPLPALTAKRPAEPSSSPPFDLHDAPTPLKRPRVNPPPRPAAAFAVPSFGCLPGCRNKPAQSCVYGCCGTCCAFSRQQGGKKRCSRHQP